MPKQYVLTKGPEGVSIVACESVAVAVKICTFAIASGCWYAFYAECL